MVENKVAFLSGKLSGTKTIEKEFEVIENPDEYEIFLKEFINLKFDIKVDNEVIYINDDQDFEEQVKNIEKSEYVSLCVNEKFSRIYITSDEKKTYVIRINKVSLNLIADLISKAKPVKFSLNSFQFFKWCNEKNIDIRNIYDIPIYIKILTNNVNVGSTNYYIEKYTNQKLVEDDNELNNVIIGNFIYEFGKYLKEYIKKFNLVKMCKMINENSYYESMEVGSDNESEIKISYLNLDAIMHELVLKAKSKFENKQYVLSPLGRIAIKFGRKEDELLTEIYNEDLETLVLNELYANNIRVKLVGDNLYYISCKFKNFGNIVSLVTAIFTDVFYKMFEEKVKIKLECILEE